MKACKILALLMASAAFLPIKAGAQAFTFSFGLQNSGACSNIKNAFGWVVDTSFGVVELLTVKVAGLPPNTDFDLFNIEVPRTPFGLAWYLGDIQTNKAGVGTGSFIGRFNNETFIISPNVPTLPNGAVDPPPNTFPSPPALVPEATTGIKTNPVQIYHLGLWFNSVNDANNAGCPLNTRTPFNGEHNAGVQILNTGEFPNNAGPLLHLQ